MVPPLFFSRLRNAGFAIGCLIAFIIIDRAVFFKDDFLPV